MLNAAKGWPNPHAVDFATTFDSSQLAAISGNIAFAGRVVHLDSAGKYRFGVANRHMAMFLFQNSDDPDVSNYGGDPASEAGAWVPVAPTGKIMALVACGAYELESTEFDTVQTYAPNQTLTAATGTTLATAGVLTNQSATPYTNAVCGVVSRGKYTNSYGRSVLAFWPVYLPTADALTS
jgi:hypothetical protein